jgi:transcriptional regulator with XRE-family HTH domain
VNIEKKVVSMKLNLDFSQLGQVIKEIRQSIGMNQIDLCRGICNQSQLSKIENGESFPQAATLYMLSKRLGVEVNTLFEMTTNSRMDYVLEFQVLARDLVRDKKYKNLYELIQSEKNNPIFTKNAYNYQFLLWHEGISMYHFKNNAVAALNSLQRALNLTLSTNRYINEREMEIMNSIAVIYFEIEDYQKSIDLYNEILNSIRFPAQIYNYKIKVRIYYNLAKALTRQGNLQLSIEVCCKAIKLCIDTESLYLLGELYYHTGYNYFLEKDKEKYSSLFNKAISVFEITNKTKYIDYINNLLEK